MMNQTRRFEDFFIGGQQADIIRYFTLRQEEFELNIEKCITFRSLPALKKEITGRSKMVVGVVTSQFWQWWVAEKKKRVFSPV